MKNETPVVRILLVDDHPLIRDGLGALIRKREDMQVVAEASNGEDAIALHRKHRPEVTLMDLGLPGVDGLSALLAIRKEDPEAKILVLTLRSGDEDVSQALKAGARGYVLKDATWAELSHAIVEVSRGRKHISREAAVALAERADAPLLTERERDVLSCMAQGNSNKEIARALSISEPTVKAHVTSILGKLEVEDRTQAVLDALRRGLVHLD